MVAVAKTGGQLITFSDRFSYTGMTGAFPATIKTGLTTIDGTTGPDTIDSTTKAGQPAAGAGNPADYGVEYTMQTGTIRYAPMQPIPPTKITAKNTKPLYPTSSVKLATTKLPIPKIQTTITQSQTYSVSSRANTVCFPDVAIYACINTDSLGRACPSPNGRHAKVPQPMEGLDDPPLVFLFYACIV